VKYLAADALIYGVADPGFAILDFTQVAHLPQVSASAPYMGVAADLPAGVTAPIDDRYGRVVNVPKVLSGRLPRSDRPDETALSFEFAHSQHLHIGDRLTVPLASSASTAFDPVTLRVVGIEAAPGTFPPRIGTDVVTDVDLSPAFLPRHRQVKTYPILAVRLRRGVADVSSFEADLHRLAGGRPENHSLLGEQAANVQRTTHLQALALWLLGGFLGLTLVLVIGQLLSRRSTLAADDHPCLRALGMTRAELWLADMMVSATIGAIGAALAVATAVAASPLVSTGIARVAEPRPGVAFDAFTLGVGGLVIVGLIITLSALPAWRATSRSIEESDRIGRERPTAIARAATATALPPTMALGVGMASQPGRGSTAVPVRSSLAGVTLALAAVAAAVTFGANLTHLIHSPRSYGWNWDAQISANGEGIIRPLIPALQADPRLAAVAIMDIGVPLRVGHSAVNGIALQDVKGHVSPVVLGGREPRAPDEVALGSKTLRDSGANLGRPVPINITAVEQQTVPKRVVGTVVLPPATAAASLGVGAIMTYDAQMTFLPPGVQAPPPTNAAVLFAPNVDRSATLADLRRLAGREYDVLTPQPPTDIVNFGRVQNLPLILAGLLAALAVATLGHTLISSVHRRARDIALLKILGFTPGQVRSTIAWQSTTVALVALLIGLPVGTAWGRLLWTVLTDRLGTLSEPATPALSLALTIPVAVAVANVVAAVPAFIASRTKVAPLLGAK
jgi:hypothetical protein